MTSEVNGSEALSEPSTNGVAEAPDLLLFEKLALVQSKVEWFADDGLDEVRKIIRKAVKKRPELAAYTPLFESTTQKLEELHKQVESFWDQYVEEDDVTDSQLNVTGEEHRQATVGSAKLALVELLQFTPKLDVTLQNSNYWLTFLVEPEDFQKLIGIGNRQSKNDDFIQGGFHQLTPRGIYLTVLSRTNNESMTYEHEATHARRFIRMEILNQALENVHPVTKDGLERELIADDAERPLHISEYDLIKEELLASFSIVGYIDLLPDEFFSNKLTSTERVEIIRKINIKDITQHYIEEDDVFYDLDEVTKAVDSMFELREIYIANYEPALADRLVISALGQYPVKRWPAIVRLVRLHRSKTKA